MFKRKRLKDWGLVVPKYIPYARVLDGSDQSYPDPLRRRLKKLSWLTLENLADSCISLIKDRSFVLMTLSSES